MRNSAKPKMKLERDVKKRVTALLDQHGWFWWKTMNNGYGVSGVADILAIREGVFMAIETKLNQSKKPTPLQKGFLNSIRSHDGFAFVVNQNNVEWLAAFLPAFDRARTAVMKGGKATAEDGATMLNAIRALTEQLVETKPEAA